MRAKNMQALTDDTKRRHPGVVIYGVGDDAHKLRYSDHNEDDTEGSKAPQSDADNVPEHRAIDVMLGAAFSKAQALAYIADLLADPAALKRLYYLIFNGSIWSRSNNWVRRDFDGDPHTDHIHVSGWAADDENAAPWPAVYGGDMATPREIWTHDLKDGEGTDPAYKVLNRADVQSKEAVSLGKASAVVLAELRDRPPVQSAPVDPAALKAVLLDPEVLAAIGEAVVAATRAEYND